jgi:hypothetical protein
LLFLTEAVFSPTFGKQILLDELTGASIEPPPAAAPLHHSPPRQRPPQRRLPRTSVEMIEKYYAAHIKTQLDAAAINIMRPKKKQTPTEKSKSTRTSDHGN